MKNFTQLLKPLLSVLFLMGFLLNPYCSPIHALPNNAFVTETKKPSKKSAKKLTIKEFEKQVGRKLVFKEKVAFMLVRKKLSRSIDPESGLSTLAMISSILGFIPYLGLFLGLIGFLLGIISLALTKKQGGKKTYKKRAWAAIIIGPLLVLIQYLILIAIAIGRSM